MLVNFKCKNQKGSISLYVLISMLFFLIILIALFVNASNKVQDQQREVEKVQSEYGKEDINDAYQEELIGDDGISIIGYDKEKEVNKPKVTSSTDENTGLIPIKWNGSNWVVCKEDDPEWYNYSSEDIQVTAEDGTTRTVPKMTWANAMLSDGKYKKGSVEVGQVVADGEEGSMFVWIPRYAYSINKYKTQGPDDSANGTTQGITKVEFLKGNTNTGSSGTEYSTDYDADSVAVGTATPMIVHPAFKFGAKSLTGIWVAKFEASMAETNNNTEENNNVTNKTVKVVPNAESWRYIQLGNIFTNCLNMKDNSIYQISDGMDTHLLKNSEFGAVAYLAASQYGLVPTRNDSRESSAGDYKSNTNQSTTGNISGIYDVNGGAWESVAAYWDNGSKYLSEYFDSKYFKQNQNTNYYELNSQYSIYWNRYESSEYEIENGETIWNILSTEGNKENYQISKNRVDLMKNIKGDAMYEAINDWSYFGRYGKEYTDSSGTHYNAFEYGYWFKPTLDLNGNIIDTGENIFGQNSFGTALYGHDYTLIGTYPKPFVLRGGSWIDGYYAGIFASHGEEGGASFNIRFPPCTCNVTNKWQKFMEIQKLKNTFNDIIDKISKRYFFLEITKNFLINH